MLPVDHPEPSLRALLLSWGRLTGRIFRACGARLGAGADRAADAVNDALLDLKWPPEDDPPVEAPPPTHLPPADASGLLEASLDDLAEVFHQAAGLVNDDPDGCWAAATEEQVIALFEGLGRRVIARALEGRVTAAEAALRPGEGRCREWVRRYRRMLAAEGRWPPPDERAGQPSDESSGAGDIC
jgi:hypothetical protein